MSDDTWKTVRDLIGSGDQADALRMCATALAGIAPDLHNRALLLSSRLAHVIKQESEGLMSDAAASVERNRISKALLELVTVAERLSAPGPSRAAGEPAASRQITPLAPTAAVSPRAVAGPSLFVSYCREDADRVAPIVEGFRAAGFRPYVDTASIAVGAEWDRRIATLIAECDYFVLCQTQRLASRVFSYVHQEVSWALDKQAQTRPGALFILPLQLDEGLPMERLAHIQHRHVDSMAALQAVIDAIRDDFNRR